MATVRLSESQVRVIWEMAHGAILNGNDVGGYWLNWTDGRRSYRVPSNTVRGLHKRGLLIWGRHAISGHAGYEATPEAIVAMRSVL